jgi:hypothetical protein
MSNSLAKYISGGLPEVSDEEMGSAIKASVSESTSGSGGEGVIFAKFSGKTGVYTLGQSGTIEPDDIFIIEPRSLFEGWVCWKGSRVPKVDGIFEWSVFHRKTETILKEDLPNHEPYNEKTGDGWKQLMGFAMMATEGDLVGQRPIKFTTNSPSGRNAIAAVLLEIADRSTAGEPTYPILSFDREDFTAHEVTNKKPVLTVHGWATAEDVGRFLEEAIDIDQLIDGPPAKNKKRAKKRT